jgi:hypothetical protein
MGSAIPFFRNRGFDTEATETLGKAYDIACGSLHLGRRAPALQEFLAKKILKRRSEANAIRISLPQSP